MGAIRDDAHTAFRDYMTDGVAESGVHNVIKADVRDLFSMVDARIRELSASVGSISYETRTELFADLEHDASTVAWVTADPTAAYNGIYKKTGASGEGSWSLIAEFSDLVQTLIDVQSEVALAHTARVLAEIAAGSAADALTGAVIVDPSDIGVSGYLLDTAADGSHAITHKIYRDGGVSDMTAPGRGLHPDMLRPVPGVIPDPAFRDVAGIDVGTDGKVSAIWHADGSLRVLGGVHNPIGTPDRTVGVFVEGGALKADGPNGVVTVIPSGTLAATPSPLQNGFVRTVTQLSPGGVRTSIIDVASFVADTRAAMLAAPAIENKLFMLIAPGNSNSIGSHAGAVNVESPTLDYYAGDFEGVYIMKNDAQPGILDERCCCVRAGFTSNAERVRVADLSGLVPYHAAEGQSQTTGITYLGVLAAELAKMIKATFGFSPKFLIASVGLGGAMVADLLQTPAHNVAPTSGDDIGQVWTLRQDFDAAVLAGKALAAAQGWGFEVLGVLPKIGEPDFEVSNIEAQIAQLIDETNDAITNPAGSCYTGQAHHPLWAVTQPTSFASSDAASSTLNGRYPCDALVNLHDAGKMWLAGNDYTIGEHDGWTLLEIGGAVADNIHFGIKGHVAIAAMLYQGFAKQMVGAAPPAPLRFAASKSGTTITLNYTGGNGSAIEFKTDVISERSGTVKGFRWMVGGVSQSISVAITGNRQIQITIPADVAGTLEYARYGHVTGYDGYDAERARGNVCETVRMATPMYGLASLPRYAINQEVVFT